MNLEKLKFQEIPSNDPTLTKKVWEGDFLIDGITKVPLELVLTEFAGNKIHDIFFSIDICQGSAKFEGDEFESLREALLDAQNRIYDLYDNYQLEANDNVAEYKWGEY